MLISSDQKYNIIEFNDENEIEEVVKGNYKYFFGSTAIYLPQTKLTTRGKVGTIPDAIVVDIESEEWFIVEVERSIHGTWNHIAPQISKQLTSISNPNTIEVILSNLIDLIRQEEEIEEIFVELDIDKMDIRMKLEYILKKEPKIAIPIDSIPKDLQEWAETLKTQVVIWTISKYISLDESEVIYKLPDELTPTIETNPKTGRTITVYELQGRDLIVEMIKEDYVEPGDKLTMTYKPRGGEKYDFEATVLEDGYLEVDGEKFSSSSYAAVHCYQKVGSHRETENGLKKWKTPSGKKLEDIREEILSSESS